MNTDPTLPKHSIFFDLETTDTRPLGQILNYSFICVDQEWNHIDELSGSIHISPCQLPQPGAILANRINVEDHQRADHPYERQVMRRIGEFLDRYTNRYANIPLIGYNSSKFDLQFLRTSLLRNGVYCYFKCQNRDLLSVSRYLLMSDETFIKLITSNEKINLKLENVASVHKVLHGAQKHESREDVLITIALAQEYLARYNIDVRTFDPYQLKKYHNTTRALTIRRPSIGYKSTPYYFDSYLVALSHSNNSSLWINLNKYDGLKDSQELKSAIDYLSHSDVAVVHDEQEVPKEFVDLIDDAHKKLGHYNVDNFFERRDCYIEDWMYNLSFDQLKSVLKSMNDWEDTGLENKETSEQERVLVSRYILEDPRLIENPSDVWKRKFKRYVQYRYGGELKLDGVNDQGSRTHPTYASLLAQLDQARFASSNKEDKELLDALYRYYESSPIGAMLAD